MEILIKYYFEIEHVKGLNNTKVDTLSRKEKLQSNNKVLGALLKLKKDGKI